MAEADDVDKAVGLYDDDDKENVETATVEEDKDSVALAAAAAREAQDEALRVARLAGIATAPEQEPNVAELKRQAAHATAILKRACEVPVPADGDDEVPEQAPTNGALTNGEHASVDIASEQALHGFWMAKSGECRVFLDNKTRRLSYEEELKDGCRLHGWLERQGEELCWQSALWLLEPDDEPWYGPSCGEEPERVGRIMVRLLPGPPRRMTSQIMVTDEDEDWQAPTNWLPQSQVEKTDIYGAFGPSPGPELKPTGGGMFVFGGGGS